jgi:hypothetical protein
MSTGLTFGSISALFGLSHGIIDTTQYSYIITAVVASAVVPTLIANAFFLPGHLLGNVLEEEEVSETAKPKKKLFSTFRSKLTRSSESEVKGEGS